MKIVYYKLPLEQGENVLVSEVPFTRDVEVSILIENDDLINPIFIVESMDDEIHVTPVPEDDQDFYFFLNGQDFDGLLPFENAEVAEAFIYEVRQRVKEINLALDH